MGLFKKIRKAIHKVDPVSKTIDRKLGFTGKKSESKTVSSGTTSSRASAGGTGPQTADMGAAKPATRANGADAMSTARGLTAGARSGVGRLQKAQLK